MDDDKTDEYIRDGLSGESDCCGAKLTPWDACTDCGEPSGQAKD